MKIKRFFSHSVSARMIRIHRNFSKQKHCLHVKRRGLTEINFSSLSNRSTAQTNLSPCASLTFRYASASRFDPHLRAYLDDRNDMGSTSVTVDRIRILTCSSKHLLLARCSGCSQTLGVVGRHATRSERHATDRGGRYKDLGKRRKRRGKGAGKNGTE